MIEFRPKTPAEIKRDADSAQRAAAVKAPVPAGKKRSESADETIETP